MESLSTKPALCLKDFFKEYYYLCLKAENDNNTIPIIDDCSYDLVFFKQASAKLIFGPFKKSLSCNYKLFTVHMRTPPYRVIYDKELTFFTIKSQPWFNGYFFSHLERHGVIDLTDSNILSSTFTSEILNASTPQELFKLTDNYFLSNKMKFSKKIELVKKICDYIIINKGLVSIENISQHFNRSRQYLNKIFKEEVLYSLKKFTTSVRILHLARFKIKHPSTPLTAITYRYNYFDQSHFIKDFRSICGVKPKQFFDNIPEFLMRHQ